MKFYDSIKNFLYDQKYFITLYNESLHIFNYDNLITISDTIIKTKVYNFTLYVTGSCLYVKQLSNKEILIKGTINKIEKLYE